MGYYLCMKQRKLLRVSNIPELLKEWDFELNECHPEDISSGSSAKIHWVCDKGHKWIDTVAHRTSDHRTCPYCNNSKVWAGFNDLESQRPDLLKEWDYTNNEIKPNEIYYKSSRRKVWWICPKCKTHYTMSPGDRERGQNCPYCARKRVKSGLNDLETLYPEIAKEWDYENNGELLPSQVSSHANKTVWWKCPNGHHYEMMINNRTGKKQQNCPICSGKKVVKGINDLFTTNPELKERWDFEKNTKNPDNVVAGCNDYAYWICEHGHRFKSRIYNMSHSLKGQNCPVCRNFRVDKGTNDLLTTHPELVEEWDYEKNKIQPTEVHAGMSKKKVWWKCKNHGHSWEATIASRVNGNGCPICANQKLLPGFNDVGTLYPEIYKDWDFEKNNGKTPADFIGTHSNKVIWLKCEHGHSYKSRIAEYCRGNRCPVCANKQIVVGYNDLGTTHPKLALEWDVVKNGALTPQQVTYGSDLKAWWKCERGHSWKAVISSRAAGRGCPECLKEYQVSLTEKTFAFYLSKHFSDLEENVHLKELGKRELDVYIPSLKLAVEYDGCNWHKNPKRDLEKDKACEHAGIALIRIREDGCARYDTTAYFIECPKNHGNILPLKDAVNAMLLLINNLYKLNLPLVKSIEPDITAINESFYSYTKQNSLKAKCPELLKEWDYEKNGDLNPEFISAGSNSKVWWKCAHGHSWSAVVSSRVRGNGCPYCSGKYVLKGFNDLASQYPSLLKEWDYEKNKDLNPDELSTGSNLKVWWKCEHGHSWETKISTRTRMRTGCPTCAGLLPVKGENDFETLYPELAKEWDYEKNGDMRPSDFLPGSEKVVWWKCPSGHSYDTQIAIRAKYNCGCPVCNNKRVVKGINDLETLHPELAAEWNYEKNKDLLPSQVGGGGGSHKKVWWKCKHGHEWEATLASRISLHTGCPTCAIERTKKKR